jgi:hypothetical protein
VKLLHDTDEENILKLLSRTTSVISNGDCPKGTSGNPCKNGEYVYLPLADILASVKQAGLDHLVTEVSGLPLYNNINTTVYIKISK